MYLLQTTINNIHKCHWQFSRSSLKTKWGKSCSWLRDLTTPPFSHNLCDLSKQQPLFFSSYTTLSTWAGLTPLARLLDKSWGLQAQPGELYCMTHHKQYKHEFLKWNENNELKSHIYCNILRASMHFSICAMCHEPSLLIYRRAWAHIQKILSTVTTSCI